MDAENKVILLREFRAKEYMLYRTGPAHLANRSIYYTVSCLRRRRRRRRLSTTAVTSHS